MSDYMIRATAADEFVRAFAVTSRGVVLEAERRHGLSPVAAAALGRAMSAALMMGADMKGDDDIVTLQFVCDGPIGAITVTADPNGHVKGFVGEPKVMLPPSAAGKLDVGGAVGGGRLRVLRDIGLKEPYVGEVAIQTGEIAEDLTYYYAVSEQTPSVVALGVLAGNPGSAAADKDAFVIREAGGYMIQLMPGCPDEIIDEIEKQCVTSPSVTDMLKEGGTPESILERILGGLGLKINDKKPVSFKCDCSRDRVARALVALGAKELRSLIAEGNPAELTCQFCNTKYEYSIEDLMALLKSALERGDKAEKA